MTTIEQARIAKLNAILLDLDAAIGANKRKKLKLIREAAVRYNGTQFLLKDNTVGGTLQLSFETLRRHYRKWKIAPSKIAALGKAHRGRKRVIPDDLIAEFRRICTNDGLRSVDGALDQIFTAWRMGSAIPGLGTWREWWALKHPAIEPPLQAPKFPFDRRSFYPYAPKKKTALRAMGNLSMASAMEYLASIERDSSGLAPGEVYVCDDVRLDVIAHSPMSGEAVELRAYIMMDWGTRRIVAYTFRAGNGLIEADVMALIARGLTTGGICTTRPTHIFLERGTVALSEQSEQTITLMTDGRVKIHRTGMVTGERWRGAGTDRPVGNFRGKAVLESFMRKAHDMLNHLPGQRGNRYDNQPGNLGFTGHGQRPRAGSLLDYSTQLAKLEKSFAGRLRLKLPYRWEGEVEQCFGAGVEDYNQTRGHQMQGFGTVDIMETKPGVWEDVPPGSGAAEFQLEVTGE